MHHDFVTNVYTDPKRSVYRYPKCHRDQRSRLARLLLIALNEQSTNLTHLDVVRLRTAFWSLTGNSYHGYDRAIRAIFYITAVEESVQGFAINKLYEDDVERSQMLSQTQLMEMTDDPRHYGNDPSQIWEEVTVPKCGKAPRSAPVATAVKEKS